jgi:hypothetical protein
LACSCRRRWMRTYAITIGAIDGHIIAAMITTQTQT